MAGLLAASPIPCVRERPRVVVRHGADPERTTREALAGFELGAVSGARVLVKPNAGRVAPSGSGIVTDARVVAAVCDALRDAGAIVTLGDSPIVGVRKLEALEASGVAEVARSRGLELLDLDARRPVTVLAPEGRALTRFKVCAAVLEHDLVVSVPVMKTHMHTGVTLAVKNMKGALWGRTKVELHMLPALPDTDDKSLDVAIADLASVLRPHFSVIDGTIGLEGLGPSAGTPKPLGLVVASVDAFAADAVACGLMGIAAESVPHLRLGAARGYGIIERTALEVDPADWLALASPFARPPENLTIEFPGVRVLDEASCSACQSTLLLFLRKYGRELLEYFPDLSPLPVAIGKGLERVEPGTLCIGNCTRPHRAQGVFVAGCPPVGSAIYRVATGRDVEDDEGPGGAAEGAAPSRQGDDSPSVLFVCTGNFYRSRFAEAVFNHEATRRGITWRAFSRGLAIHLAAGDLSLYTERALDARGIGREHTAATRVSLTDADLERATRVIVLDEEEHRPLVRERFPAWEDRVTYWTVPDVDRAEPEDALPEIERRVLTELFESLG